MKKIQIEQDLFVRMVKYFFSDELGFDDDDVCEFYHDIKKGIDKKLDAISKRGYYTQYKTAGHMNNAKACAEEVINHELIYV